MIELRRRRHSFLDIHVVTAMSCYVAILTSSVSSFAVFRQQHHEHQVDNTHRLVFLPSVLLRPTTTNPVAEPEFPSHTSWYRRSGCGPANGFPTRPYCSRLFAGSSPPDDDDDNEEEELDNDDPHDVLTDSTVMEERWKNEETLLAMHLSLRPGVTVKDALSRTSRYVQSFPFAAVLPVQPLQYLPSDDGIGVEVTFLRKKTDEKGTVDGGIRFFVIPTGKEEEDGDGADGAGGIEVVAKRNSMGQTIAKIFAERLVIQAFVGAMRRGQDGEDGGGDRVGEKGIGGGGAITSIPQTRIPPPTVDVVSIQSVFHMWM